MTTPNLRTSSLGSRITDVIVLTASFLLLTMITGYENISSLFINLFCYVLVFFVCLRISKRIIFEYVHSSKRFVNILFGNITGLVSGGLLVFMIYNLFPGMIDGLVVMIFSSIMAFFILGTLSPMVKSSHNDIIHH